MITSAKITAFTTLYLVVFALVPGAVADFLLVPEELRSRTLAACALFLVGVLLGWKLVGERSSSQVSRSVTGGSDPGLVVLGITLLLMMAYIVEFGPKSPIFAAASGYDLLEVALIREEAIKLNADTLFVKAYSFARDLLAPAAFVLALESLTRSSSRPAMRIFSLVLLCSAIFIGIWSGQKATLINYILAAAIFLTRDTASLMRLCVLGAPAFAAAIFSMFLVTYPGTFDDPNTVEVVEDVWNGLIHRLFVSPFEVSIAYVDAIDNQSLIHPLDTIPIVGAMLRPGVPSLENVIGTHYFYSGIDSISANALCFAYAYIVGGLPFCFVVGVLTSFVLILSMRFVRAGGNVFMSRAFQAVLVYKLLDLLTGNPLSYLIGIVEMAVSAWFLSMISIELSRTCMPVTSARVVL